MHVDSFHPILDDSLVGFTNTCQFLIDSKNFGSQVMTLHDDGFGFGTIARAYLTAAASNGALTPDQVLALRQEGVGWGQIKKEYGVQPGGNGLGSIMGKKSVTPGSTTAPPGVEPGNNGSGCPGNSCNAPGQQNPPKGKPTKAPKK